MMRMSDQQGATVEQQGPMEIQRFCGECEEELHRQMDEEEEELLQPKQLECPSSLLQV